MAASHWFEQVADVLGSSYLRYSFTRGTDQEVGFLVDQLGLHPGDAVLDVGCGPGRHAYGLADRGIHVVGIDISQRFVDLARHGAPPGADFERADARDLAYDGDFDAVISLCQGAFGLTSGPAETGPAPRVEPDLAVLAAMARAVRPGGVVALTAFSAYFQVAHLGEQDGFDADRGVNHEHTSIHDEAGVVHPAELWTTVYTPRELRLLAAAVGLEVEAIWSVEPGRYAARPPDLDHPEFLVVARRPPLR